MDATKQALIDRLMTRIQGCYSSARVKNTLCYTRQVIALKMLSPYYRGAERPTILPLAGDQNRVAMHMVSSETLFLGKRWKN